eukprot:TRINITY_DN3245_c0_g1_i1.p1 TRINITY_DN3245_c0_g1~~TRINITY_DN3245_c0_g1_i1.p1  ORF type:complete len:386 (-),score=58.91 TRINITY_DN3245_c0_g1_i1:978-2018(-)
MGGIEETKHIPSFGDLVSNDDYSLIWIWWIIGGCLSFYILRVWWIYVWLEHTKARAFNSTTKRLVQRLLLIVPVLTILSLMSIIFMRLAVFFSALRDLYLSVFFVFFHQLVIFSFGGEILALAQAILLPPDQFYRQPPLTCCFPCIPKTSFRQLDFYFCKFGIYQICVVKPAIILASLLLVSANAYNQDLTLQNAFSILQILDVISAVISAFCFNVFENVYGTPFPEKLFHVKYRTSIVIDLAPPCTQLLVAFLVKVGFFGLDGSNLPQEAKVVLWTNFLLLIFTTAIVHILRIYWPPSDYIHMSPTLSDDQALEIQTEGTPLVAWNFSAPNRESFTSTRSKETTI